MDRRRSLPWLLVLQLAGAHATLGEAPAADAGTTPVSSTEAPAAPAATPAAMPADSLLASLRPEALRQLAADVLERNPDLARARQRAAAAAARAPQARSLADPMAGLTLFALPPETRVGPQRLQASISQHFPLFGKLALREKAALWAAAAAASEVETLRLDLLTETRRLFYELAFLDRQEAVLRIESDALTRYEEAARARYASGSGLQQETLRIQAQITRTEGRLLEIAERRASLSAELNALRDWPADFPVDGLADLDLPAPPVPALESAELRELALAHRPEIVAADAEIERQGTLVELARKGFRPDLTVGLGYTVVDRRADAAGRANPPEDDGDDVLALTGSINLPVRHRRLEAALEEALASRRAADEGRRRALAEIERSVGDLRARMPLLYEHWQLLERVLQVQAREALRSAEAAYTTGKLGAVDLLDAEVVLFEVQTAAARTLTDYLTAWARLERAVASPLGLAKEDDHHVEHE